MPTSDRMAGPAGELAAALRALRAQAGTPSTRVLARRVGTVSHTTVAETLAGRRVPSWPIVDGIVRALGGDEGEFRHLWLAAADTELIATGRGEEGFVSTYLAQVAAFTGWLELPEPTTRRRVPLDKLYVPQQVMSVPTGKKQDIWTLDDQLHRAVILGDAGIGKSTACRALMNRHAVERERPVPFLINLREFSTTIPPTRSVVGHIEHIAEAFFQVPASEGAVARLLSEGRALVIFDGLDELPREATRATASIIELFCSEFPRARVLATARPVGYAQAQLDPELFPAYRLLAFSQAQIADYVNRWFAVVPDLPDRKRLADAFLTESKPIPGGILSNPLLLGLATQVYKSESLLPRNLTTLYDRASRLLLEQWDRGRGISTAPSVPHALEPALSYLAFRMLDADIAETAEHDLLAMLTEFLTQNLSQPEEAPSTARAILDYSRSRAWMITQTGTTEHGDPLYQFTHRTFMEYFAAQYIASTPEPARELTPRLLHHQWREVAGLVLQVFERRHGNSDRFLATVADEIEHLAPADRQQALDFLSRHETSEQLSPTKQTSR
jgi:hypothetical protein